MNTNQMTHYNRDKHKRRPSERVDILKGEQQLARPFFAEVEQLATSHKLGTLQTSYTKTDESKRLLFNAIVWTGVSILGAIFLFALVLRLALPGSTAGLSNYLTAALLALIGLVILYGCFRQGQFNLRAHQYRNREQVHIYIDGMVYLEGQIAQLVVRWEQIAELTRGDIEDEANGKVVLDRLYLTLQHNIEQQILFQPTLPQRTEICAQVEQAYTDARLPALLAQYESGEQLAFDELSISKAGVSIPRTPGAEERALFVWRQLEHPRGSIEVGQPYTTIMAQSDGSQDTLLYKEFTCELTNACLLKALLTARTRIEQ